MSLFEFIMVLLSIVVGLGMARILSGFSQALLARRVGVDAWLPLLLAALVFVTLVQVWWEAWILNELASWTFWQLLLCMANPVLLYVLSHLLFPVSDDVSLRDHYFDHHRLIFAVIALGAAAAIFNRPLAFGTPVLALYNAASFATMAGATVLALTASPRLHALLVPAGALLTVFDIAAGMPRIS